MKSIHLAIMQAFPEQFSDSDGFLGIAVGPGWLAIVEDACREIAAVLTPEELTLFHWTQIKEKFGGLRMYWGPHNIIPVDLMSAEGWLHFDVESDTVAVFSPETAGQIQGIVTRAQERAALTCDQCGKPGLLYRKGVWVTLCKEHAREQNKV
jgi:hypothetical protein